MKKIFIFIFLTGFALNIAIAYSSDFSFEENNDLPLVNLNLAFKFGAAQDPKTKLGLSNFLGELMLRGTKNLTKKQIDETLDLIGAKIEVETGPDSLIFKGSVLSNSLNEYLQLLEQIILEPSFPKVEHQKLKQELISAVLDSMGKDQQLASNHFDEFLFGQHPYSHPVLGKKSTLQSINESDVKEHYSHYINASQLVTVGFGDANSGQIESWLKKLEARLPEKNNPSRLTPPQNHSETDVLIVDKPDRTQTQIFLGQIGIKMNDPSFFPLYLGNYAFGGGSFVARLMKEVRVKRGWSYGAYSGLKGGVVPRSWRVYVFPATKDTSATIELILKMIHELAKNGISEEEFSFAQKSLINGAGFMFNTPKKRVDNRLLERVLNLPNGFMQSYASELNKLSRNNVNQALRAFLKPDQLAIVLVATAAKTLPELKKISALKNRKISITPYNKD